MSVSHLRCDACGARFDIAGLTHRQADAYADAITTVHTCDTTPTDHDTAPAADTPNGAR